MKLLLIILGFILATLGSTSIVPDRQNSLDVLNRLQATIPNGQLRRSRSSQEVATEVLNTFYRNVLKNQMEALQLVLNTEAELLSFGESIEEWCWKQNAPLLEGIMKWIGVGYNRCIYQLDNSVNEILTELYSRNHNEDVDLKMYSMLKLFQKKNIVSNPQAIEKAFATFSFGITDVMPELNNVQFGFEDDLNEKLSIYSGCLTQQFDSVKPQIDRLLKDTNKCMQFNFGN